MGEFDKTIETIREELRSSGSITFCCNDCKIRFTMDWDEDPTTSGGGCLSCGSSNWVVRDCYGDIAY